jgi:bleomycin hydrolase
MGLTKIIMTLIVISLLFFSLNSQNLKGYEIIKVIPTTEIKDQGHSGTCWSFATISFLETEVLRKTGDTLNLSEMYIVRKIYPEKVKNYLRTQGRSLFSAGGQPQDALRVMREYGLVPEIAYPQKLDSYYGYNTAYLDTTTLDYVKGIRGYEDQIITENWTKEFDKILNQNLGKPPVDFTYEDTLYTPQSFCNDFLELNPSDYVQITSYNHHPYNEYFCLESKYNWSFDLYFNLELPSFMSIIENALLGGYSVVFNGDVSEDSFDFYRGIATWKSEGKDEVSYRQKLFENGSTTVDHVMHIVGIAQDESGKKYFLTKNSWGKENACSGYMYLSEDFVKYKTVSILVNKDVLK